MNLFARPVLLLGILLCLALSACGDQESSQRKEFIEFLQTRILDKPGAHVPQLSGNQKDAFGPYVKDYAIITDFAAGPSGGPGNLQQRFGAIVAKGSIRSMSDLASRREDLVAVQNLIDELGGAIDQALAKADAAKEQLKQPEDLKIVFDKAYERDVTAVADNVKQMLPPVRDMTAAALRLSDFIAGNKDRLEVAGMTITAKDQKTLTALQPLLDDFNAKGRAVMALQQKFRSSL
ncbi:DUF3053 domain-containing protein [Labrys okinawensis]|uniref:DUF3053 domain-containing protein n=1 Tax=Labrys okinawensis TaxID=346911 RepID=A0A2S9QJA1_9HYPH|nr:DUF3053 family protein [Labrys okinawensis]PRH89423.1 DUF3053 domain-containing protein [Labrys okinawensis]